MVVGRWIRRADSHQGWARVQVRPLRLPRQALVRHSSARETEPVVEPRMRTSDRGRVYMLERRREGGEKMANSGGEHMERITAY